MQDGHLTYGTNVKIMVKEQKYVAYLRVSTKKQGYSGLGLEAQKEIILRHLQDKIPIAEFVEVESGRKAERAKLKEALKECRKTGATLIVAKLDRLARNVSFLSSLLESDVEIVFCDFPQANKMVLHILSAISQYEAELTASRTKQALKAKNKEDLNLAIRNTCWTSMNRQSGIVQERLKKKLLTTLTIKGLLLC